MVPPEPEPQPHPQRFASIDLLASPQVNSRRYTKENIGSVCVIRAIYSRIYHVMPLCYNIDNIIRLLRLRLHITLKDFLLEVNRCYRVSKRRRLEQGK